jgi:hypothetical protein
MKNTTANGQGYLCALDDSFDSYVSLLKQDLEQQCANSNRHHRNHNGDLAKRADERADAIRKILVLIGEMDGSCL